MPEITILALIICLLPIIPLVWITQKWAGTGREMVWATARMLGQLLAVGYVLVFIFNSGNPLIGLAVIALMIVVSSVIGVRKVKANRRAAFWKAAIGIGFAGSLTLMFIFTFVIGLSDPWYQPRLIIPLAGMTYSNAMTAITLAAERLQREEQSGSPFPKARSAAWDAALIPQINGLLAVGLVSLPGMMTGQILSGVDPLIAVRYQIVVMVMVLLSAGYAVAAFLWLSGRTAKAS